MEKGYALNVAVLTRNRGYRDTGRDIKNPPYIYRRFPRLRLALSKRHALYNRQLELVENLEDEGRLLAIRPKRPLEVGRLESNIDRLTALYEEGYECAEEALHRLTGM